MWVAHFGMVIFLIGALGEGLFQTEVITRAKPGETIMLAGQEAKFTGVEARQGPNYQTETAVIDLFENGRQITTLYPEKRFYPAARQTTTEAAIRTRLSGDHYIVLGDGDAEKGIRCDFITSRWSALSGWAQYSWPLAAALPFCAAAPHSRQQ